MSISSKVNGIASPQFYDQTGRRSPKFLELVLRFLFWKVFAYTLGKSEGWVGATKWAPVPLKKISWKEFQTVFSTYGDDSLLPADQDLPQIEVLFVVEGKDFSVLPFAMENAQRGSRNIISSFVIVTPAKDLSLAKEIAQTQASALGILVAVVNEDEVFSETFRTQLKSRFGNRYGWVLQQLLTTEMVYRSKSQGVLVIDSDTVLLHPRVWLTSAGQQTLLVSRERHWSYYEFLSRLNLCQQSPEKTFVTHHMLMQPKILREIFAHIGLEDVESLGKLAIDAEGLDADSPVCLEYEVYGQGISKLFPNLVHFAKFANRGISRPNDQSKYAFLIQREATSGKFQSISFHTYL